MHSFRALELQIAELATAEGGSRQLAALATKALFLRAWFRQLDRQARGCPTQKVCGPVPRDSACYAGNPSLSSRSSIIRFLFAADHPGMFL